MNYILHVAARQQAVHARAVRKEGHKSELMETDFRFVALLLSLSEIVGRIVVSICR